MTHRLLAINSRDEGPMGLDRPGGLPNQKLVELLDHPDIYGLEIN